MNSESSPGQKIAVPPHPTGARLQSHGCSITLRQVHGPLAREVFLHCQPPAGIDDAAGQADAIYRAIAGVLESAGASFGSVVSEMVFLRDLPANIDQVRAARQRVLTANNRLSHRPATTEIGQPPLLEHACLEVSVQAVMPHAPGSKFELIEAGPACGCDECAQAHGVLVPVGDETRFYAAALCGAGETAHEQTLAMFARADALLQKAGMAFSDVVRTWIHLRDIDRDYAALNRARRAFFAARGIDPVPASTGIGGGPVSGAHDLCLGIYAVKAARSPVRTVMTSPTLNEAPQYGADFVRGMKVVEENRIALHVSGTASIDEQGRSVHCDDFDAQADRMLVNIAALLDGQGASFGDAVSAITYLKHAGHATRLREKLHAAGFADIPSALVVAPICRPDLLCETEVLAVLPRDGQGRLRGR